MIGWKRGFSKEILVKLMMKRVMPAMMMITRKEADIMVEAVVMNITLMLL